jgi:hypothetical protein
MAHTLEGGGEEGEGCTLSVVFEVQMSRLEKTA